jgi:hypothetical protein
VNPIRIACIAAFLLCVGVPVPVHAGDIAQLGKAVAGKDLERQRGGQETQTHVLNDMQVNGTVTGNTASRNATGHNNISNAFTGASGLPIVVQNTGNNVLIQNATIVNLQMQ